MPGCGRPLSALPHKQGIRAGWSVNQTLTLPGVRHLAQSCEFVINRVSGRWETGKCAAMTLLGPYAEGNDGTEEVVFAAFMGENHAGLTPLERFGFILPPRKMSACYGVYSHQRVEWFPTSEIRGSRSDRRRSPKAEIPRLVSTSA